MQELTKRQKLVLTTIQKLTAKRGFAPTIREIAKILDIQSPNGVVVHLKSLERKGYLRRSPHTSRALLLVDGKGATWPQRGLPLLGQVAAGALSEAIENAERLDLERLFKKPGNFALKVRGDSMIDAHICDGDYVIVQKQSEAQDGEIVVALTGDGEATVKYFHPEKKRVRLQPANKRLKPIFLDSVEILGVVVGIVRNSRN